VLWESITTPKDSTGMSLYNLVYGKEAKMSISLDFNALIFVVNIKRYRKQFIHQKENQSVAKIERRTKEIPKSNFSKEA
jgi:hypothetical protein